MRRYSFDCGAAARGDSNQSARGCTHPVSVLLALTSLLIGAPYAQASPRPPASITDWAQTAAHELAAADIASERALVPDIRRLAAQVAHDVRSGLAQVRELNNRKGWLDAVPVATAPSYSSRSRGPGFDRSYMQDLVQSHLQALTAVRSAEREADPDVRALAAALESTLEMHLARARDIGWRLERFGIDTGMKEQLSAARNEQGVQ